MAGGVETYSIYLDDGAWNVQPISAGYPRYRTYDDATNPADITQSWAECDNLYCDYDIPAPSPIVITCSGLTEESSSNTTPSPSNVAANGTEATEEPSPSETLLTPSPSTTAVNGTESTEEPSSSDLLLTPTPAAANVTATTEEPLSRGAFTPSPSETSAGAAEPPDSSSDTDAPIAGDSSGAPATGGASTTETASEEDGSGSDGLSEGAIAAISAAILALVGGGLTVAFKNNNIHCCHTQHVFNSAT
ncbi:unnamed protein product [Ectocarpus fasciculatus]